MGFSDLPLELMYQIADYLDFERDINALVRTSKRSYGALNGYLYRHHIKVWDAVESASVCLSGLSNPILTFINEGMLLDPCRSAQRYIIMTAACGQEDNMKYLLEMGVDPSAEEASTGRWVEVYNGPSLPVMRRGPFDFAVRRGQEGAVRLLVPHMKRVDYFLREEPGNTPLTLAARNGHLNLVRMLVEELKCNLEPTRHQEAGKIAWTGTSPLGCAAYRGHINIVRYLIGVGADPNAITKTPRRTVLGLAVEGNNFETAKTLVEHGSNADLSIEIQQARSMFRHEEDQDTYAKTFKDIICPLIDATYRGNQELLKLLFQHIDLERVLRCGVESANFLVPAAAACGLDSIVQRLLDEGCDVSADFAPYHVSVRDSLSVACKHGHIDVVQILLDRGADPYSPYAHCLSRPLAEAVNGDQLEVVELLLDAGVNPNTTHEEDDFICEMVADMEHVFSLDVQSEAMLRLLLSRGADPFVVGTSVWRGVFRQVLSFQDVSVLKAVLDTKLGSMIVKEEWPIAGAVAMAAETGTLMFEYMMQYFWYEHGLKPLENYRLDAALEPAIKHHNAEVVEILLQRYGLELKSESMADYLASAASSCRDDQASAGIMLDVLLRHGADINATRHDGETCLSLLVKGFEWWNQEVKVREAKLVIERGAKYPLTYDEDGVCCLSAAVRVENFRLLELLLGLIEAQGISPKEIGPHLKEAYADITPGGRNKLTALRLKRALQNFNWRRRYPVPEK